MATSYLEDIIPDPFDLWSPFAEHLYYIRLESKLEGNGKLNLCIQVKITYSEICFESFKHFRGKSTRYFFKNIQTLYLK